MSGNPSQSQPRHRTKGPYHNVIRGGSGKVLYDSDKDDFKSTSTIYGGDGKKVLKQE